MWPLGKKRQLMTTDAAVSVLADEIRAGMEPYTIALGKKGTDLFYSLTPWEKGDRFILQGMATK